jgi:heptosyltransferase II
MTICVFLPNWVGDLVMATPVLRAMRRCYGAEHRLVGILRPHLAELLAGTNFLDEMWLFDPKKQHQSQKDKDVHSHKSPHPNPLPKGEGTVVTSSEMKHHALGRMELLRRMRQERFDMVVLLTNSFHTAILAWLSGAKRRIGYARDGRGLFLTDKLYPLRARGRIVPAPMVDSYLALAFAAGCGNGSPRLELATTASEEQMAAEVWQNLGLRTDGRVIALNSSGAFGAAKLWPAEHFARLAQRVVDELDHDVLILCGPQEREMARDIAKRAERRRVFSLADQPVSLALTKDCLRRTCLTVSTDSGPRHIAAAWGKPVITLLGPTMPVWIENPTVRGVNLQLKLDCIGCGRRVCPLGHHRCMVDLKADQVFEEVVRLLNLNIVIHQDSRRLTAAG